jgi:hypothetical protein
MFVAVQDNLGQADFTEEVHNDAKEAPLPWQIYIPISLLS